MRNGSILAVASLLIRLTGLGFSAYISNRIGAEITGMNSLINSVYSFALTLAISGVNIASTRLCAQAIGTGSDSLLRDFEKKCLQYASVFGCASTFLLFVFSTIISNKLLDNSSVATPLRILSFTLPFISVSSSLNGYFAAVGRVSFSALYMACEQITRIITTALFFSTIGYANAQTACTSIAGGALAAESVSCIFLYILYKRDLHKHIEKGGQTNNSITKKLLEITMPVAVSSWIRTVLRSSEHILIPKGLTKFGNDNTGALSQYGIVNGMALTVVLFPATVLSAFTGLLVPELSRETAANNTVKCGKLISGVSAAALMFSFGSAAVIFACAQPLGEAIFPGKGAGEYIKLLSLLIPIMYMDTTVDFMLKGLGEQVYVMKINILDSGLGVLFSLFIIPTLGIKGYILSIFFSEIINAFLSTLRLVKCAQLRLHSFKHLLFPFFSGICACTANALLSNLLSEFLGNTALAIILCTSGAAVYILFLFLSDCIPVSSLKWLIKKKKGLVPTAVM